MHQPSREPKRTAAAPPPPPPAPPPTITVYADRPHPISEAYAAFVHGYGIAGRRLAETAAEGLVRIGRNLS